MLYHYFNWKKTQISQNEGNSSKTMVFYKCRQENITEENIRSIICVYTMQDSPIKNLYNNLHYIYTPLLIKVGSLKNDFLTMVGY